MEQHIVKVRSIKHITQDVINIVTGKPLDYNFTPGQATEIAINKTGWREESRPFTFVCLPEKDYLEFMIKTYPSRQGVTNELLKLNPGDELILHEVFGMISYQGKGTFIAGGAGITPFIAIFRDLKQKEKLPGNRLIFANKTKADIILHQEFEELLGKQFINILSDERVVGYHYGLISEDFLRSNITGHTGRFYVCGPPPMMEAVCTHLSHLGIPDSSIIQEGI